MARGRASLVPPLGTDLQSLVVALFILFDQPLQADIAPDFIAEMVGLQQEQQAGNPAVAVSEGMDAKEIEIEGRQGDQRMDPPFLQTEIPHFQQAAIASGVLAAGTVLKRTRSLPLG